MALPPQPGRQTYTKRDTMLYALGIGVGRAAAQDFEQLRYVYEENLVALPTMATTLAVADPPYLRVEYGIDLKGLVHGEEELEMLRPLRAEGTIASESVIEDIYDKGPGKGPSCTSPGNSSTKQPAIT